MTIETSVKRVEDIRFLKGKGEYVDDIKRPHMAYLGLVRSTYSHAKILRIDFSKAKEDPDYIDGLTGKDIDQATDPIMVTPGAKQTGRKQLAIGEVRFVGEPVAAFVSKSRYAVEDIAELVSVEYEELPHVGDVEESKAGSAMVFDGWKDNCFYQNSAKKGDVAAAISSSKNVIRATLKIKRQAGVPIEPRSYVSWYDKDTDQYEIEASAQRPHGIRNYLATELKTPPNKFHVVVRDVGGAFGTKGAQSYCEPVLGCVFAKRTGYAIKATATRTDDFFETAAGRDSVCHIELACDSEGKITGLRARIEADVGVSGTLSISPRNTLQLLPEVYKIPNLEISGFCYLTNKAPLGPVRGAGRPEADFFMERAIDLLARHIKMDPLEFRKRNLIEPNEMPYDNGAGSKYDSGNFPLLLEKIKAPRSEMLKWRDAINGRKKERILAGTGLCIEVEDTGAQLKESAKIMIGKNGKIIVMTGSTPHGQGLETTLAQLCSEEIGVPLDDVAVEYGDTKDLPFGIGTFGSRSISVGGSAVVEVARKAKEEIISRAKKFIDVRCEEVSVENGQILKIERDRSGQANSSVLMSLGTLVEKSGDIEVYTEFSLNSIPFASGAHACSLTIDVESGKIQIHRYVAVDDCGVVINPMIVDGQLHGGIVHGIGGSLLEEIVYDKSGQLLTTSFLDYAIPGSLDIPREIDLLHVETPSTLTLNGAKGVGESGTIAAYACVINALNDALAQSRSDAQMNTAPVSPEEILSALKLVAT